MSGPSSAAPTLTRSALDGHVEQDVLGVVQTEYAVDVSAATPGFGDYQVADDDAVHNVATAAVGGVTSLALNSFLDGWGSI